MEDRETARMRKYGKSKTTRIMMATVPHVTSGLGLRKFQADGFLLTRVYITTCMKYSCANTVQDGSARVRDVKCPVDTGQNVQIFKVRTTTLYFTKVATLHDTDVTLL